MQMQVSLAVVATNLHTTIMSSRTMTRCQRARTIKLGGFRSSSGQQRLAMSLPYVMKEFLVSDLSTEFEKISDKAKTATNNLRAANQHTRDQLAADAARARDKATAAANHLKDNAVDAKHKASSHWEEIRGKWKAHVAEVQSRLDAKADKLDARAAVMDADISESYARDAIDFAQAAVEEAEYAALDAMYARADADELQAGHASGV